VRDRIVSTFTKKRIRVTPDSAGPYIMLPVFQLDEVKAVLDREQVPYTVDDFSISIEGDPAVTVVNLGRDVDAATVQRLFDSLP
jgi:hypothetical protein